MEDTYNRKIDRLYLGLPVYEKNRVIAQTFQRFKESGCDSIDQYLRVELIDSAISLYTYREQIAELALDEIDAGKMAKEIAVLLDCNSADEFLEEAAKFGIEEEVFLRTYDPKPGELQEFYRFLGLSDLTRAQVQNDN